ncbi:MAG TPA: methyltransferase domain-containing protein [Pirellulales bacterium]|jgi:SAM-dependent methyltransferase|nr:methyltransferase domain-containing protein [Pirellulales bacterium]
MCKKQSWSQQYNFRRAVAARFGRVFDLPLERRVRDVLLDVVRDEHEVLEVGAGDRRMSDLLAQRRRGVGYRSMDIDPLGNHDYHSLEEVDRAFDCIFSFEVAEHIAFDDLAGWFERLAELLKPGGQLALSTPNTYYPPAYLRDASHRTPLCYDELGGMLEASGLRVTRIVRIYNDPVWRRVARRWLFGWLFRLIGIDFARQIVVVAQKPEQGTNEQLPQSEREA